MLAPLQHIDFIDLKQQYRRLKPAIDERMQAVLNHGQYIMGPEVAELEKRLAEYVGVRHAIGISDGTTALQVAMMALGIGPGDEVITTPFTFIATAETISLLGATPVFVDIDPDTAGAVAANLRAFEGAEVRLGDVTDLDMDELAAEGVDAIFADPARRTGASRGSARITDPEQWSPPLSLALGWASTIERVGIKVAPGIAYEHIPSSWHAQWVSVGGDLVEASLWSPALSPEGRGRSCLLLDEAGAAHSLSTPEGYAPNAPAARVEVVPLGAMVAEPDSAVIRSGLLGRLADEVGAGIVSDKIAYLTGADLPDFPFYDRFEVLAVTNLRAKAISAELRTRGAGSVEIKKRGADISPDDLRKSLKLGGGDEQLTVIATRVDGRHRAIICRRLAKNL